jgi:hypothetical protein
MKISVELSDSELKEVCRFTGLKKKGPAIRKMVVNALQIERRKVLFEPILSGKWGAELKGFEESRDLDRKKSRERARIMSE